MKEDIKGIKKELESIGGLLYLGAGADEIVKNGYCVITPRKDSGKGIYLIDRLDPDNIPEKLKRVLFEPKPIDKP